MDSLSCQLPIISKRGILLTKKVLQARGSPPAPTARGATLPRALLTSQEKELGPSLFRSACYYPKKT